MNTPKEVMHQLTVDYNDIRCLEKNIKTALINAGFDVKNPMYHVYPNGARTIFFPLAESHAVISEYKDERKAIIYIASCNFEYFRRFMEWARFAF